MTNPKKPQIHPNPRLNPWRDDIAAGYLRGEVDAPKFVEGTDMMVVSPVANLLRTPADNAMLDTQLLYGEIFRVYEKNNGWAWGQSRSDDYVGYIDIDDLGDMIETDMQVCAVRSFVYSEPDIKSRSMMALSMGAQVKRAGKQDKFIQINGGGWMVTHHLVSRLQHADDFVAVAEQFIGMPYLWGGRESTGLDCSALVQIALMCAGFSCPRDTDIQEGVLGTQAKDKLRRGDLIFWKRHVGILRNETTLLHANLTHMKTVSEDFEKACARIAETGGHVTSIKRMPSLSA